MDEYSGALTALYADTDKATMRYHNAVKSFEKLFGNERDILLISAPGRTEICGNHTDHQRGSVLAAAVNLDIICVASPNSSNSIHIVSEGYEPDIIDLADLAPQQGEKGKAAALIRGVASWFKNNGYAIGGLIAYTTSQVLSGSGLSSSAAFEVAVGNLLSHMYNGGAVSPEKIAIAGKYAENEFFGKPSGLMDQMASSVGGFVQIDFANPINPIITPLSFDLEAAGYSLCVMDTKGSHANLTAEYTAIPLEMRSVAEYFGKRYLSEVEDVDFYTDIPKLRDAVGDRAVLRAMHFFSDNARVSTQANALRSGDIKMFLSLVIESGESSFSCLQNIYVDPREQNLSIALAVSKRILSGVGGAWRVHGGGFAGTIQAFVPHDTLNDYRTAMEDIFGVGSCHILRIRPYGGVRLWRN